MSRAARPNSGKGGEKHPRRTYYIKKEFQRAFILKFCLVALAAMAAASLLVYYLTDDTVTATYRYHRLLLEPTSHAIFTTLLAVNLAVALGFVAATVYVTLFVSHKIAGPLFRFEQDLALVGEGDLTKRIRLREGDQLGEFAEVLNRVNQSLHDRVKSVSDGLDELAEKAAAGANAEELARGLAELSGKTRQILTTE